MLKHGLVALLTVGCVSAAWAQSEPAFSVIADFEDRSYAPLLVDARAVLLADCTVRPVIVPARGRGALSIEVGATQPGATVACELTFREPLRFRSLDSIVAFCWINDGRAAVGFRLRDARGQRFETAPQPIEASRRWIRVAENLASASLKRIKGDSELAYPIEVIGFVVRADQVGKQLVFVDDLQVEHKVTPRDLVSGVIRLSQAAGEATRLYAPGATVDATVLLENRSHQKALDLTVDLAWMRPDGAVLQRQSKRVNLQASGADFRAYQKLDFSQAVREPGLYRLVASVRAPGWSSAGVFETSVAVIPGERRTRGRSTLFAVRSNLLREPESDQTLEVSVARDAGANLLVLDAPWRALEPRAGAYELTAIDSVRGSIAAAGMAAALVVAEPPDWLPTGPPRVESLAAFLRRLGGAAAARSGEYILAADVLGTSTVSEQFELLDQIRAALGPDAAKYTLYPPPIDVSAPDAVALRSILAARIEQPLAFRVRGEPDAALAALEAFRKQTEMTWRPSHVWLHDAPPLVGAGGDDDLYSVVRMYVRAAAAGVGALVRSDLRDDDADPLNPGATNGLLRRDFSPKTSLLGFALAARPLTGFVYGGSLRGAPPEFETALFIGGSQQLALIMPRPNRVPLVALPVQLAAPGETKIEDLQLRPQPSAQTAQGLLVPPSSRPLLLTATFRAAQPEPSIVSPPSWLRCPAIAFAEDELSIEVVAPRDLSRSFVQFVPPKDAPYALSELSLPLKGDANTPVGGAVRVQRTGEGDFNRAPLSLRVSLEGETFELPMIVRPMAIAGRTMDSKNPTGVLGAPNGSKASASGTVTVTYSDVALRLSVRIEDDRVVAPKLDEAGVFSGDELLVGVALEGADEHAEVRLVNADSGPRVEAVHRTPSARVADWQLRVSDDGGKARRFELSIPAKSLGEPALRGGRRVLLGVRYLDDDADGFQPAPIAWGGGLDGSRATDEFRWVRLGE